jgi:FkbM family methyltransferase
MSRLAGAKGQIHAFEANGELIDNLEGFLADNGAKNVVLNPLCVYSESGVTLEFHRDPRPEAQASSIYGRWEDSVKVPAVSLDDYCTEHGLHPSVLKIDVESAEIDVLKGSIKVMASDQPAIVFEYTRRLPMDDPVQFLIERGYSVFEASSCLPVTPEYFDENKPDLAQANLLAVPASKMKSSGYDCIVRGLVNTILFEAAPAVISIEKPGRYVLEIKYHGSSDAQARLEIVEPDARLRCIAEGNLKGLRDVWSSLAFEFGVSTTISVSLEQKGEQQAAIESIMLYRITFGQRSAVS